MDCIERKEIEQKRLYQVTKITELMKYKNSILFKFFERNDMEPIDYCTQDDLDYIKSIKNDSIINSLYYEIETNIEYGVEGLSDVVCPFCILHDTTGCKDCFYAKNHGGRCLIDHNEIPSNTWVRIVNAIDASNEKSYDILSESMYQIWWEAYDHNHRDKYDRIMCGY